MKLLHGNGGHYSLVKLESFEEIDGLEADSLNWIFTGTSGVHGSGISALDLLDPKQYEWISDQTVRDEYDEEYKPTLTILVIHPRLVCAKFGDVEITKQNVEWLREQEIATLKAINSKYLNQLKEEGKQ